MRNAAQSRDADAFSDRVDYPRVRESLKGQLAALMAESLGKSDGGLPALGTMLGMALVQPMVDALVRPETVMRAMQTGEFGLLPEGRQGSSTDASAQKKLEWTLERKGMNRIVVQAREAGQTGPGKDFGLVLDRQGFADWKLTEIRLPRIK